MVKELIRKAKGFSPWQKVVLAAFLLALGFTGFQIFRTVQYATYWRQHRDEPIAGWMRVGYVANSYHIPPPVLYQAISLPADVRDRRPLAEIARSQNRSFEEIKADLERAIVEFRVFHPPPNAGGKL